jgi:uncharacterized protein YgiM (DUF1202 family)
MKKILFPSAVLLLGAALPVTASAAFTKGGSAYTKRVETSLLAEPSALAATVTKVAYAKTLKVEELKGNWVKVSDNGKSGWVFAGNLAEEKPDDNKGLDGLPIQAASTTATAAARPLTPAASDYASRHGSNSAADDIKWLHETADAITPAQAIDYLKEQKRGEFK